MKKKVISIMTAASVLIAAENTVVSAAGLQGMGDIGNDILSNELNSLELQILSYDLTYDVEGGKIYFDSNTGSVTYCDSTITSAVIPEQILGVPVVSIGNEALMGCSSLTSVTMPNSIKSIGENAFSGCSNLASITIPNSVSNIGYGAFSGCSSLASITIPDAITSIGASTFSGCSSLANIAISSNVTNIGNYAFYGCSSLRRIVIPNSVTSIGSYAFEDCRGLTSIVIPNSVISIGYAAFRGCQWYERRNSILNVQ